MLSRVMPVLSRVMSVLSRVMPVLSRVMSVKFSVNFAVESGRGLSPRPARDKYLHGKTEKRAARAYISHRSTLTKTLL